MTLGLGVITVQERVARATALAQAVVDQGYGPGSPVVSVDKEWRGPWWNFRFTAELLAGEGHTHLCVLQDDVLLCHQFWPALVRLVERCPCDPLSLFTARRSIVQEADRKRTRLLRRYGLDTAQGLVFPVFQFQALCRWVDAREGDNAEWKFHDDVRIDAWSRDKRWPIVYAVPTLIDHDVSLPSTLGHNGRTRHGDRVSPRFIGTADSEPAAFDWGAQR